MSGCCVVNCKNEVKPDHGFQQIAEVHEVTIKTFGLLCEEHWQVMMEGQKIKDTPKVPYCSECSVNPTIYSCPLCKVPLCTNCLMKHEKRAHVKETQQKDEPEKEAYTCRKCSNRFKGKPILFMGKPYCADCWIESQLWRSSRFASDPVKDTFQREWKPLHEESYQTRKEEGIQRCYSCKKKLTFAELKYTMDDGHIYCGQCGEAYQQQKRRYAYGTFERDEEAKPFNFENLDEFFKHFGDNNPFFRQSTAGWGTRTDGETWTKSSNASSSQQTRTSYLPRETADAFSVLGITPTQDANAIKKAYRKLAIKYHPDKPENKGNENKMKQINAANDLAMKYAGKK